MAKKKKKSMKLKMLVNCGIRESKYKCTICLSIVDFFSQKANLRFHNGSSASVKLIGETSEWSDIKVSAYQGCVMPPWLFNVFKDGELYQMRMSLGDCDVLLNHDGA